jgi:glycosyltransferase involved in cell wall biosynthesis
VEPAITNSSRQHGQCGFVIFAPSFVSNSAGIGCLYRLCHELRKLGFQAFMTGGQQTARHLDAPLINVVEARALCERGFTAIYPETVSGNPVAAESVIRWVLNRPGLLAGDAVYSESEHVFYYSEVFRPYIQNRVAGKLYMPTIDEEIFYSDGSAPAQRSLECFYVGKSVWREGVIDRDRAIEITREFPAKAELGKLFRAARVLYCFDNSTILVYEALLCGCPVVIIPDGTQSWRDYGKLELGTDGIAWGVQEYSGEPVDVPALRARYADVKRDFHRQLHHMIRVSGQRPEGSVAACSHSTIPLDTSDSHSRAVAPASESERVPLLKGLERSVRQWRKKWQRQRGERRMFHRFLRELIVADSRGLLAERCLTHRSLKCFYLANAVWQKGVVDRSTAYEVTITPQTTLSDLVNLFRSSAVLYCFDPYSPIVQIALACGCPVVLVRAGGWQQRLKPADQSQPAPRELLAEQRLTAVCCSASPELDSD